MKIISTFLTGTLLLCFCFCNLLYAQQPEAVRGTITDATTNETLIGVSVKVKGTSTGAQTDINGAYAITAPATATLIFTYIGYASVMSSILWRMFLYLV